MINVLQLTIVYVISWSQQYFGMALQNLAMFPTIFQYAIFSFPYVSSRVVCTTIDQIGYETYSCIISFVNDFKCPKEDSSSTM